MVTKAQLESSLRSLRAEINFLRQDDERLGAGSHSIIQGIIDRVTGANRGEQFYELEFHRFETSLSRLEASLRRNDLSSSEHSLEEARHYFSDLIRVRQGYQFRSVSWAESLTHTTEYVRNISAGATVGTFAGGLMAIGPYGAFVGGLAAGIATYYYSPQERAQIIPRTNQQFIQDQALPTQRIQNIRNERIQYLQDLLIRSHIGYDYVNWSRVEMDLRGLSAADQTRLSNQEAFFFRNLSRHITSIHISSTSKENLEQRIQFVMAQLYVNFGLTRSIPNQASSIRLLLGEGGNDTARCRLILWALGRAGISLPAPQILGIQNYEGERRVVIYNTQTREVWDLLSGEKHFLSDEKYRGKFCPIYRAGLLIHEALIAEKEVSPAQSSDFLIPGTSQSDSTSSGLGIAQSNGIRYLPIPNNILNALGNARERNTSGTPSSAHAQGSTTAQQNNHVNTQQGGTRNSAPHQQREAELRQIMEENNYSFIVDPWGSNNTRAPKCLDVANRRVFFRERNLEAVYQALPTAQEKQNFLVRLFEQEIENTHRYRSLMQIYQNPESILRLDGTHTERASRNLGHFHEVYIQDSFVCLGMERGDTDFFRFEQNSYYQSIPALRNLLEERNRFGNYFSDPQHLRSMILRVNQFPSSQQEAFFVFMLGRGSMLLPVDAGLRIFNTLLHIPIQEVLSAEHSEENSTNNNSANETNIPLLNSRIQEIDPQNEQALQIPFFRDEDAIPAQAFILFLVNFSNYTSPENQIAAYQRWTPEISQAFLRMNQNGYYDGMIQNIWRQLLESRGISAMGENYSSHDISQNIPRLPADLAAIQNQYRGRHRSN